MCVCVCVCVCARFFSSYFLHSGVSVLCKSPAGSQIKDMSCIPLLQRDAAISSLRLESEAAVAMNYLGALKLLKL